MQTEILYGQNGTYTITQRRPLATGHSSVLYIGENNEGISVCIKMMRNNPENEGGNDATNSFLTEIKAQSLLKHQNILQVLDYGEKAQYEQGPFIVYPLCKSGTLRGVIDEKTYVPVNEALKFIDQIGKAIDFAHSCGFIHGDVKPENILFENDRSQALLSDFGMSRYFARTESFITAPTMGGSTAYLSPEQIKNGEQSGRSDIYSLGIVAFELLTGKLPFDSTESTFNQMSAKVHGEKIDPLAFNPNLSKFVSSGLQCALNLKPNQRPYSAANFCQMLRGEVVSNFQSGSEEKSLWVSLDTKVKAGLITTIITAIAGIIVAIIKIAPELIK